MFLANTHVSLLGIYQMVNASNLPTEKQSYFSSWVCVIKKGNKNEKKEQKTGTPPQKKAKEPTELKQYENTYLS